MRASNSRENHASNKRVLVSPTSLTTQLYTDLPSSSKKIKASMQLIEIQKDPFPRKLQEKEDIYA